LLKRGEPHPPAPSPSTERGGIGKGYPWPFAALQRDKKERGVYSIGGMRGNVKRVLSFLLILKAYRLENIVLKLMLC